MRGKNRDILAMFDSGDYTVTRNTHIIDADPNDPTDSPIEHTTVAFEGKKLRLDIDYYRMPNPLEPDADDPQTTDKFLVFTFLLVSRLKSHSWRPISRNSFVFTFTPTPGGTPLLEPKTETEN